MGRAAVTLDEWRAMRWPVSRWRHQARRRIRHIVDHAPGLPADAMLALVDAGYPFGERAHEPYKCWLKERELFREALAGPPTMPTADEAGACEVARDLVELGRLDEARKLVEERAPNRLAMRCLACGARAGEPCIDLSLPIEFVGTSAAELLVPHHVRLVGHADAEPLFEARKAK